jgi:AAA15 family ATPase/GTPase
MIKKLFLKNFRGIEREEVQLGKINVLTGANNSGKSSIIYGLLALKNLVINPNQSLDSFLNLGFLNLGGFSQTVYMKDENKNILLGLVTETEDQFTEYRALLGKKGSNISINVKQPVAIDLSLDVVFPYPANSTTGTDIKTEAGNVKISWNGITSTITVEPTETVDAERQKQLLQSLSASLSNPLEELRSVDFVSLRRGFTKPNYASVPLQPQLLNEDELATLLASDRDLEGRVAYYLEKIIDRMFSVRATIGTANFNLQSRDRSTGFVCDLVNEGFGTNQLVTILTKSLRKETSTICIEETEIHLHPELMDKFINVLIEIAYVEDKQFIITTHSEHIVSSILTNTHTRKIEPEDLKLYYLFKDKKKSNIELQKINEKGQVEGGLKSFYQTDLRDIRDFFNIKNE